MQIKQIQRVVGLVFPTTRDHNKKLKIKLGTSVHLKTWVVWLITLCRMSGHHRNRFLWKCRSLYPFLCPGLSNTLCRVSLLRRVASLPSFWHCWGSEFFRILWSTAADRCQSARTFFQWHVHHVILFVPLPLSYSALSGERFGNGLRIGTQLSGFVKWLVGGDCPTYEQFCRKDSYDRQVRVSLGLFPSLLALCQSWSGVSLVSERVWS